jgi:hypothetical protein
MDRQKVYRDRDRIAITITSAKNPWVLPPPRSAQSPRAQVHSLVAVPGPTPNSCFETFFIDTRPRQTILYLYTC